MKVLVVGGGAREHAICDAVSRSDAELYAVMKNSNPGIKRIARDFYLQDETVVEKVVSYAVSKKIELAVVGPEAPEKAGLANSLREHGIAVASPSKEAAKIETDKEFMRTLMEKHHVPGTLKSRAFSDAREAKEFIDMMGGEVAVKPVGLTGGKGVRVAGDHFDGIDGAMKYAEEVITRKIGGDARVLIEEKAVGEEFTLQAFCDGSTIIPTPAVQDHKRLLPGDMGPNTGGMGSYSDANGLLPFMDRNDYEGAVTVLQRIIDAMNSEGITYNGVIYGQFMLTGEGPRVIEINARWGDPEAMNIIPLLNSDFVEICMSMVEGTLDHRKVDFEKKSTVCKYVVPEGYGVNSMKGEKIFVDEDAVSDGGGRLFYASVDQRGGDVYTTTSRSLAIVGVSHSIGEAERICEECLEHVKGEHIFIRHDIGKEELIQRRIDHMTMLRV